MSKPRFNHVHKYKTVKWGKKKTPVLKCMIPGCPHYVHKEMALNRKSICWGPCGQVFTMNAYAVERRRPKCDNCIKRKTVPNLTDDKLTALITGLVDDE